MYAIFIARSNNLTVAFLKNLNSVKEKRNSNLQYYIIPVLQALFILEFQINRNTIHNRIQFFRISKHGHDILLITYKKIHVAVRALLSKWHVK